MAQIILSAEIVDLRELYTKRVIISAYTYRDKRDREVVVICFGQAEQVKCTSRREVRMFISGAWSALNSQTGQHEPAFGADARAAFDAVHGLLIAGRSPQ